MPQTIPADHARHDLELIAGHAAGDVSNGDRTRADAQLASCTACVELRRDLVAIAAATRTLRSAALAPPDFRLTETQAASLRRGGWITTLLRAFAGPRSTTRPMAMAFTSLGLAGLLVANILPALLGGTAASVAPQAEGAAPGATAAAAPSEAPARGPVAGPQASRGGGDSEFGAQNPPSAGAGGDSKANEGATNPPDVALGGAQGAATAEPATDRLLAGGRDRLVRETNWTTVGSLGLLAIGLALFALRFIARRLR